MTKFKEKQQNGGHKPVSASSTAHSNPHIREAFGIEILKSSHPAVRRLKRTYVAELHGNKFWKSSYLIMDYLLSHQIPKRKTVMDLGCGWGVNGIYCAKFFKSKVISVDADQNVFPFLELLAEQNQVQVNPYQKRFERLSVADFTSVHTIMGSDICFWDSLCKILWNMITRAKKAGVKQLILADPGRSPFHELAQKCIKKYDATLLDYSVKQPINHSGYLLIISL